MGKRHEGRSVNEQFRRKDAEKIIEVEGLLLNYLEDKGRLFMLMNAASRRNGCGVIEALSLCPQGCTQSGALKMDSAMSDVDVSVKEEVERLANRITTAEILMQALNARERFVIEKFYIQDYKMQDVEQQYADRMTVPISSGALRALKQKALVKLAGLMDTNSGGEIWEKS